MITMRMTDWITAANGTMHRRGYAVTDDDEAAA
jgi:hypothetical protein